MGVVTNVEVPTARSSSWKGLVSKPCAPVAGCAGLHVQAWKDQLRGDDGDDVTSTRLSVQRSRAPVQVRLVSSAPVEMDFTLASDKAKGCVMWEIERSTELLEQEHFEHTRTRQVVFSFRQGLGWRTHEVSVPRGFVFSQVLRWSKFRAREYSLQLVQFSLRLYPRSTPPATSLG